MQFHQVEIRLCFSPPGAGANSPLPIRISTGEIKYAAPDKGLIRENSVENYNSKTRQMETDKRDPGEHWACDGKYLYQVDHRQKTVEEFPIPPALQGTAITQGPLPFVFGAKAAELKARYYIRPLGRSANGDPMLEILPKYRRDAANFSKVEIMLRASDMFPTAIKVHLNENEYEFYELKEKSIWDALSFESFSPEPFGYKVIKHQPQGNPAPPTDRGAAGRRPGATLRARCAAAVDSIREGKTVHAGLAFSCLDENGDAIERFALPEKKPGYSVS